MRDTRIYILFCRRIGPKWSVAFLKSAKPGFLKACTIKFDVSLHVIISFGFYLGVLKALPALHTGNPRFIVTWKLSAVIYEMQRLEKNRNISPDTYLTFMNK